MEVSIIEALGLSVLGIIIVFLVLVLLMAIINVMSKTVGSKKSEAPASPAAPAAKAAPKLAPGSCGEVATFSVPDRVAAMVMAITADQLNVPLNELRFISIKEAE